MLSYTLNDLSPELILEIVSLAATPSFVSLYGNSPQYPTYDECYGTAVALTSVSHAFRQLTLPHLLHTVFLSSTRRVNDFINALALQRRSYQNQNVLRVDYSKLVKRFWVAEYFDPPAISYAMNTSQRTFHDTQIISDPVQEPDFRLLYSVLGNVKYLGLTPEGLAFLYKTLSSSSPIPWQPPFGWKCTSLSIGRSHSWRWRPLTSTPEGIGFLSKIETLTFGMNIGAIEERDERLDSGSHVRIPIHSCIKQTPFELLSTLKKMTIVVVGSVRTRVIIFGDEGGAGGLQTVSKGFKQWAQNGVSGEFTKDIEVKSSTANLAKILDWELGFM